VLDQDGANPPGAGACRVALEPVVERPEVEDLEDLRLIEGPLEAARSITSAMSSWVRATVVQGMFRSRVVSAGVSVVERWTSIPARLRSERPGTVTSIRARCVGRSSCSAAAERCESTAPCPQARTVAM
jgi:hypothetical protein